MIAQGLASSGAKVYITGRRADVLEKAAAGYQGKGSLVACVIFSWTVLKPMLIGNYYSLGMDVVDEESIKKGVRFVSEVDGKLDILVNK
jgi:NAD(P)-dependent dehydrogenase (short-subunit alcohol dehydrogenase family)